MIIESLTTMRTFLAAALFAAVTVPALAQDNPAPVPLPGGATATTEQHTDWTVSCRVEEGRKLCAISQALADSQSGERVLAVELATPAIDQAEGMLLAPFGLRLGSGVQILVDDAPLGEARPFLTCIASGCLVPLSFGAGELSAIRAGDTMRLVAQRADAAEPVDLDVSLAGFAAAANRSVELGN